MLATLGRYFDPWEAHILRSRLEAEGIPAYVIGDQHIIANWPLSVALGGVALQVPRAYLVQAHEILTAYHAGTFEEDLLTEHPEARESCTGCGASELAGSVPISQRALAIAAFLLASAPFPTRASRIRCKTCGHHWRYGDS